MNKFAIACVIALVLIAGGLLPSEKAEGEQAKTSPPATITDAAAKAKIDPGVYTPYDRGNHPKTFAALGELVVLGPIQELRERGALHAARQMECDRVMWSELSTNTSTQKDWNVFVDCQNGTRYRMNYDGSVRREKLGSWK